MAALRQPLWGLLQRKPIVLSSKGNATAYAVGEKVFKKTKGATPRLKDVVRLHRENSGKFIK
jgi:hypothetical protein